VVTSPAHSTRGWPFLVARGRRRGYKTILAPDFLTERNLHGLLSQSSSGADLPPDGSRSVVLEHRDVGAMTAWYRTEQVSPADLAGSAGAVQEAATDEHGRPLEILYGVVAQERVSGVVEHDDWSVARRAALRSYRRFLEREDDFGVDASAAFALHGVGGPKTTRPAAERPRHPLPARAAAAGPRRRSRHLGMVVAAGALALAVAWIARPGPGTPDVRIAAARLQPAEGLVDCEAPRALRVTATFTTTGPGTVAFHWEGSGPAPRERRLEFAEAGAEDVTFAVPEPLGAPRKGSLVLVLDTPEEQRLALPYDLGCRAAPPVP
jgi:hypothetical protein